MPVENYENLRKGDWIVVTDVREEDKSDFGMFFRSSKHRPAAVNGIPLSVLAYSYPFLAVTAPGRIFSLDVREYSVSKCSRSYVNAFVERVDLSENCYDPTPSQKSRRKNKREKPDPSRCVNCGRKLRKRFQVKPKPFWVEFCPDCGWSGDPVFVGD